MREDYPKTRKEARALGQGRYWTGKVCVHGHLTVRSVYTGRCKECERIYQRARSRIMRKTLKCKEYQRAYQAKYRLTERGIERRKIAGKKYNDKLKGKNEEGS